MDKDLLRRLALLNQLSLTENEKEEFLSFYSEREEELKKLDAISTTDVERMVHVLPVLTVVREDVVQKTFDREDLQKDAPETDEGYWCVPKVVE